jgi:hypothetical protein
MKMVVLALAALLILGGGGAGIYFFVLNPAAPAIELTEEELAQAKIDEEKALRKAEKAAKLAKMQTDEMDPMILPILDRNGVKQTVSLVVSLQVYDLAAVDTVTLAKPKLKSAFITDMYGLLSQHASKNGGALQISKIKRSLNKVSHKIMGDDVIYSVQLQVVQKRPV